MVSLADRPMTAEEAAAASLLPKRRRPVVSQWVVAAIVAVAVILSVISGATNKAVQWHVVGQYLFNASILNGAGLTMELSALSMAIALVLGVVVAIMRLSGNPVISKIAYLYIWLFRSIPLLVLLIVWDNISLFYPKLGIGIPYGPTFASVASKHLVTAFGAAVAALALNETAYASEIFRAAILAISGGQWDAGTALGMPRSVLYRRIVLPQAVRIAIPPLSNDTINMVKSSAMVAFIAVPDLLYSAQVIYQSNFLIVPLLVTAAIWYIVIITALTLAQGGLERYLERATRLSRRADSDLGEVHA